MRCAFPLLLLLGCGARPQPPVEPRSVEIHMRYELESQPDTEQVKFLLALPRSAAHRQRLIQLHIHPEPTRRYVERGTPMAEWVFAPATPMQVIEIEATLELLPFDLATSQRTGQRVPPGEIALYRGSEQYIETSDPKVSEELAKVPLIGATPVEAARRLYQHVTRLMDYGGYASEGAGALGALEARRGDCTDYADLLVALARAHGLPARHISGFVTTAGQQTPKHSWVEILVGEHGWIPLDPLWGDQGRASFERRPNVYIQMYANRNEPFANFWRYWWWGERASVKETLLIGDAVHREQARGATPRGSASEACQRGPSKASTTAP